MAKRCLGVVVLIAVALSPVVYAQERHPLTTADLAKQRGVNDPQVSPDGKWIAYTVSTVDAEKDKRDTDLWMVSWDGADRVRLTSTAETSESRPRWSPDGRYLAFLSKRGNEDEKKLGSQVWLLDRRGGEAVKLTSIKGGVSSYAWSPDGKRLVLVVDDYDPSSDPEKKEGWKRKTAPPIVIDRYHFKQDREGYLAALHSHLQLFDVESHKSEVLTSGIWDEKNPSWSPDGRFIAFISNHETDPDRADNTDVFVVEPKAGAQPRKLTTFAGTDDGVPSWSPDSQSIAYLQGDEPKFTAYNLNKLAVISAAGGAPRILTSALDRAVQEPIVWSADGKQLSFIVQDDRITYIGRMPAAGGTVEKLTNGLRTVSSLSPRNGGAFALLSATDTAPDEVHTFEGGSLRRITHENDEWLSHVRLGTVEDFTCTAKDGNEVHGLLFKPPSYVAGTKYPTLLNIHGGPNSQDQHAFSFERQFLAANGYVVLATNYRGSAGRGTAYQKAIFADWGNKEVIDLLAAVDSAVKSGIADPDRLGIGGWSYGGILTDYTTASDSRFKAAVAGAGSALQLSMYGSDQYVAQYDLELGPPWKNQEAWLRVSYPFLHADRIKTPTLYLGGQADFNVPIIGGEQMYQALRSMGVDTQLIIYPEQYHGITMPSYAADRLERYVAWYDKYLKPAERSAGLVRYFSGSHTDVAQPLHGPALILAGGGTDQDAAFQSAIDRVRGCIDCDRKLDVVVLRASGADGYNDYFMGLKGVNSVHSLVITDRAVSSRPDVVNAVKNAEIVFFAGGDQCNYIRWIKGTPVESAVKSVYARGGAVGGTSAGLAIQGDISYDSCPDQSATSEDVLKDPYSIDVSLSRNFFEWPPLRHVITDTHFKKRDRMGRLLVFLARAMKDGHDSRLIGFGVNEAACAIMDDKGKATVFGTGPVDVVLADHPGEVVERGRPLTYRGFKIWHFDGGQTIDLAHLPAGGYKTIDVVEGKLSGDPY
ncbi:MAG TPA: prolyl oligopeptidase family serine peptidase [Thermoanaerobaculia bacterium]|jgi:cyanophycinase